MSKNHVISYLLIAPAAIYMLLFVGYPLIYNMILSFQNMDLSTLNSGEVLFVGFENYRAIFQEEAFHIALRNTLVYTFVSILFQFIVGFLLALFFANKFKGSDGLRGFVMIAWLIPQTITALLFTFMLGSTEGIINQILLGTGLINESIGFLSNPNIALFSIIAVNVWIGIPFNMLLISTGLSNLPDDVYEAASIEGASNLQQIFYITLPMLKPVLLVVIMLGFIYTFKVFDLVFIMTGGGPINATEVLSTVAYRYSFVNFDFGLGAAAANILFIILFLISLVYLMMTRTEDVK